MGFIPSARVGRHQWAVGSTAAAQSWLWRLPGLHANLPHGKTQRTRPIPRRLAMIPSLRDGEIAAELPARFDASLYYIGRIRTPWKRTRGLPEERARIGRRLHRRTRSALGREGLSGLETVSHVLLLYWMDKARRDLVLQSPRHYAEHRGTFALALAGASQSDRGFGGASGPHRRQHTHRGRPRLRRQHAAPRHQTLFRVGRFRAGRAGRLARGTRPVFKIKPAAPRAE